MLWNFKGVTLAEIDKYRYDGGKCQIVSVSYLLKMLEGRDAKNKSCIASGLLNQFLTDSIIACGFSSHALLNVSIVYQLYICCHV